MQTGDKPTIQLRIKRWHIECAARGLFTDRSRAVALGLSQPYISRLQNGQRAAGDTVIAAALTYFPDVRFDDLFEVVR